MLSPTISCAKICAVRSKRPNEEFDAALSHTKDNQMEVLSSSKCGCAFCRSVFPAREISDWSSEEGSFSALCPHCGMPSVIPDSCGFPLEKDKLKSLNLYAYGDDYMQKHPDALRVYCARYISGEITHKPANEELLIKYLTMLHESGDVWASSSLGYFYESGGEFHAPDLDKAVEVLSSKVLFDDEAALTRLGTIYIGGYQNGAKAKEGYEALSKAMALGSEDAIFHFARCYFEGIAVKKDPVFAFTLIYREFESLYERFRQGRKDIPLYIEFANQIGKCCEQGLGTRKDKLRALRYYLLTELGIRQYERVSTNAEFEAAVDASIKRLAKELGFQSREPVFDQDSFFDTFAEQQETASTKRLVSHSYSPADETLHLDIEFSEPEIFIDIASLRCEFVEGSIHWEFRDVESGKISEHSSSYHYVHYIGDDSWAFVSEEDEEPTAYVTFKPMDSEKPGEGKKE